MPGWVVSSIEARQRAAMAELAASTDGPEEAMRALWERLSTPELRPFVRLFFYRTTLLSSGAYAANGSSSGARVIRLASVDIV
jgi:hypothetical protein